MSSTLKAYAMIILVGILFAIGKHMSGHGAISELISLGFYILGVHIMYNPFIKYYESK